MKKFKGLNGKFKIVDSPFLDNNNDYSGSFRIINEKKETFCNVSAYSFWGLNLEKAKENAKIISQAANIASKHGLYPSELLEQRNALIKTIIEVKDELNFSLGDNKAVFRCIEKLESSLDSTSKALRK